MTALITIPVGVVVERRKAESQWIDYTWQPTAVLVGEPVTPPWTMLSAQGDTTLFYAGSASIELHRSDTAHYRDNLAADLSLWIVLQPTDSEPPYEIAKVTADPHEGEAYAEAGNNIIESVPMPDNVRDIVAAFIDAHHVEQTFFKRKRDRADSDSLGRRGPIQGAKGERES